MESGRRSKSKKKKPPTLECFMDTHPEHAEYLLHLIATIEGLEAMVDLEELYLAQNQLTKIAGIENCKALKKLNLSNNSISKIQGLEQNTQLQTLWLNENPISCIENLGPLSELKILFIAGCQISQIGPSLIAQNLLEQLNLSGNRIGSFKEALNLVPLQQLRNLSFSDPNYGDNPMCNLCNYQTYVLHHLPHLDMLDTLQASEEAKMYAESTFIKKRMYYNMRIKTIQRSVTNSIVNFEKLRQERLASYMNTVASLTRRLKEAEKEFDERTEKKVSEDIAYIFARIDSLKDIQEHFKQQAHVYGEILTYRLMTELGTGGNIRYEEGNGNENWFKSCSSLVETRFYPAQLRVYDLHNLNITRVIRIHNRFLRNRFEETLEQITDIASAQYKKSIDYLFYGVDPTQASGLFSIVEDGFQGKKERIPLVNTVGLADLARIRAYYKDKSYDSVRAAFDHANRETDGSTAIPPGIMLVCKVFLLNQVEDENFPTYSSNSSLQEILDAHPVADASYNTILRKNTDDDNQRIWFISDNRLVLPEYLIEFDYFETRFNSRKDKGKMTTELPSLKNMAKWYKKYASCGADDTTGFELCSPKALTLPNRSPKDIITLNLYNSGLQNIECLEGLINLKNLIVTYNHLEKIDGLETWTLLKRVDAGYNYITQFDFSSNAAIQSLELNGNQISQLSLIYGLAISCPEIQTLTLFGNPVTEQRRYRKQVISGLASLQMLDHVAVMPDEVNAKSTPNTITKEMIRENSSFCNSGNLLSIGRYHKETTTTSDWPDDWESKIEVLQLNHMQIELLEGLDTLKNLKKATFINNEIEALGGLGFCTQLQELSLESNFIKNVEGISCLLQLRKLDLGNNQIIRLGNLTGLEHLTQLSIENNNITRLENLQGLKELMELYIANNNLAQMKDLLNLKMNSKLIILDISGNPMSQEPNIRDFAVFHLKKLKVLDGSPIDNKEQLSAKNRFSGRLTEELLQHRLSSMQKNSKTLDLSRCKLRDLGDMVKSERFPHLTEMILNENNFSNINCIEYMPRITWLQLNKNNIETLYTSNEDKIGLSGLPNLVTLDVSYNWLIDFYGLQFASLRELKILRASNNSISKVEHLEGLRFLKELDLRNNKIKEVSSTSFPVGNSIRLLRLDDNQIISLTNFGRLANLQSLYLSGNKIKEAFEIEKIADLDQLTELILTGNPMTRKSLYRAGVIKRMPNLAFLDDKEVTVDEVDRVDQFTYPVAYSENNRLPPLVHYAPPPASKVSVKLTSVNFESLTPLVKASRQPVEKARRPSSTSNPNNSQSFHGFNAVPLGPNANRTNNERSAGFGGGFPGAGKRQAQRSSSQKKPGYFRKNYK